MHTTADPKSPQGPAREACPRSGHSAPRGHRPSPFPQTPGRQGTSRGHFCRCLWGGRPGGKRTRHLPREPRRGDAEPPLHLTAAAAIQPCPARPRWASRLPLARLHLRGRRGAAAAAAQARLRKPAGARRPAKVDQCHLALASPPPVSALTPPGPRQRRLRRRAICRLSCSCPSPLLWPRVTYIGAHRLPRPPCEARHRLLPVPQPEPQPASARGAFVPGPAAAGNRSQEGAFSSRLR